MAEAQDRSAGVIGTVLHDKWRIDAKIARGGVATVYRATHRQGQVAAIKIMHPEYARNAEVRKRFLREGYAANKVGHRGVVRVLDDDVTADGSAYIVMELLEHGDLLEDRRERLGGKLPVAEAVEVCHQVLDVLAVAHEKGIIHRDIKPENIFVLADGTVKVLDFGIAHIREAAKEHEPTATGMLLGTPEYMSPEQVLGKRGYIDAQTDVYAVGAMMFTLLSGESVHTDENLNALLVATASRQARSLASASFKDLPRPLIAVVDKALALEKPRRWASARAMQVALREAVPARPSVAPKAAEAEPIDPGPPSAATLVNAPVSVPAPRSIPPMSPPSFSPGSAPTAVIHMHGAGDAPSDPWTDELGADDLDAPTVATSGSVAGKPSPAVRSIVERPPLPSMHADGESTVPLRTGETPALLPKKHTDTVKLDVEPATPRALPRTAGETARLHVPRDGAPPPWVTPPAPAAFSSPPPAPRVPPHSVAPPPPPVGPLVTIRPSTAPSPVVLVLIAIAAIVMACVCVGACIYLRSQ
jgi:serine/threonine protein kinase